MRPPRSCVGSQRNAIPQAGAPVRPPLNRVVGPAPAGKTVGQTVTTQGTTIMKRRLILASMAAAGMPCVASATDPKPLLTVSGRIARVNNHTTGTFDFTERELLELPQSSITTGTSWTPVSVFVGPTLLDVMAKAGVTSGLLNFKTLDDYAAPIPWEDLVRYGVILAHSQDGKRLSPKRWGPLWTIYPRDQYPDALKGPTAESRFIWQVNRIEVSG